MKNNDHFTLVANVIMGDRPEPFFPFCLESVKDAVDLLILNDNSANPQNPNLKSVRNSRMFNEGKIDLLHSDFKELGGFAGARNLCLDRVKELLAKKKIPHKNLWIMYLDCDEVHPPELINFVKNYLSKLPPTTGIVDGYMYQFILTFDFYTTLERRHNLFFRYDPEIKWERPVHETLVNLKGKRLATGYTYNHYGYLLPPDELMKRWELYDKFNGLDFNLEDVREENMLLEKSVECIPFHKGHPRVLNEYIRDFKENPNPLFQKFQEKTMNNRRNMIRRTLNFLRHVNYELRLKFRDIQAGRMGSRK